MAAADDDTRSGISRRDALRLLAASTTTVAAGSVIVSQPALADSGSTPCRYNFTGTPTVAVRLINQSGNRTDFLSVSVTGVTGTCPCQKTPAVPPVIDYSFFITIPGTGTGAAGWMSSSSVSVSSPTVLWPNGGGTATVSVGIRVTCPAAVGTAVRCRWGTATFNVAGPNSNTSPTFTLTANNGNSAPPTGIPSCEPSFQRSAPLLTAGNSLSLVPGRAQPPTIDTSPETPSGGLTPVEPSTTTTAPTTTPTTTTTSPPTTTPTTPPTSTSAPTTTSPPSTTLPPG